MTAEGVGRPEVCVGAIAIVAGELLLIQRGRGAAVGQWSIPGGRVERGELLSQAVEREFWEETGLRALCGRFVGWVERISPDHHFVIADFEVTIDGDDRAEVHAGDDAADAQWFPLDALDQVDLVGGVLEFLVEHGYIP